MKTKRQAKTALSAGKNAPRGRIAIDRELCKGCKYCVITCPKKAIAIAGKFNGKGYFPAVAVEADKCTGCALCAEICPEVAIEVWRR